MYTALAEHPSALITPLRREDTILLDGVRTTGLVSAAAKLAGLTRAAASRRLHRLASDLALDLVRGQGDMVALTPVAESLLHASCEYDVALQASCRLSATRNGTPRLPRLPILRMATLGTGPSSLTASLACGPTPLLLSLRQTTTEEGVQLFESGEVDAVYLWHHDAPPHPRRTHAGQTIQREILSVAMSTAFSKTLPEVVGLHTLRHETWVVTPPARALLSAAYEAAGLDEPSITELDCPDIIRGLVAGGHAISLASPLSRPTLGESVVLHRVAHAPIRTLTLLTDPTCTPVALAEHLGRELRDSYQAQLLQRVPGSRPPAQRPAPSPADCSGSGATQNVPTSNLAQAGGGLPTLNGATNGLLTHDDVHLLQRIRSSGSINQAASELAITQPALTRRIHRLEARLSLRLLLRTYQGSVLTPAARDLLDHAHLASERFGQRLSAVSSGPPVEHLALHALR